MEQQTIIASLDAIEKFKNGDLKYSFENLSDQCIRKHTDEIGTHESLFEAACIVKKASVQIDEIVHALGIRICLPHILLSDEKIISLSLASAATGDGIDLVTTHRIAEFKFSKWQKNSSNGTRRRAVFADLVSLYLEETVRKKELYVFDKEKVKACLHSQKAKWRNVLSKNPKLLNKLQDHLAEKSIHASSLYDISSISNVDILDINETMNNHI